MAQGGSIAETMQSFPDKGLQVRSFKLGQTLKTMDFLYFSVIEVYASSSYQKKNSVWVVAYFKYIYVEKYGGQNTTAK